MRRKESSRSKIFDIIRKITIPVFVMFITIVSVSCGNDTQGEQKKDIKKWDFFRRNAELLNASDEEDTDNEADDGESKKKKNRYRAKHLKLSVKNDGEDIFAPRKGASFNYRYGPSLLLEEDGGISAYLVSPGDGVKELDWITYMHSDDRGKTWSDEKVVLSPTPMSKDELSVCDPDVFFYDGYYYLGYTSTMDSTKQGIVNSVFLARAENPEGPFKKWNGRGWGGDPEPILYYDGVWNGWGSGEPSFVILDNKIFVYSTKDSYDADNNRIKVTEVHTADITRPNWPALLSFVGYAVVRTDTDPADAKEADYIYSDSDSWDVAYVEEYRKFVAVSTNRRFADDSCLLYYESNDGVYFDRVSELNTNVICGCHNSGIMADGQGHIKKWDPVMIGYGYSGSSNSEWGTWACRIAPVSIDIKKKVDRSEEEKENLKIPITYSGWDKEAWPVFVAADSTVKSAVAGGKFNISYARIDSNRSYHIIDSSDIDFSGWDEEIVNIEDGTVSPVSEGLTPVTISYNGLNRQICLRVFPEGDSISSNGTGWDIEELFSPVFKYTVSMSRPFAVAVRPLIRHKDYSVTEISLDGIVSRGVEFESMNGAICEIREDGIITPLSPGDTQIRVSCAGGYEYQVNVSVVE